MICSSGVLYGIIMLFGDGIPRRARLVGLVAWLLVLASIVLVNVADERAMREHVQKDSLGHSRKAIASQADAK
jgi:hypothetical protein